MGHPTLALPSFQLWQILSIIRLEKDPLGVQVEDLQVVPWGSSCCGLQGDDLLVQAHQRTVGADLPAGGVEGVGPARCDPPRSSGPVLLGLGAPTPPT